jgi:hypothetical protein
MIEFMSHILEASMFFSLLILVGLLVVIIHTDVTRFEIDLSAIATASLCVISVYLSLGFDLLSHFAAVIVMFAVSFVVHRLYHRGFGLGDYYLFAFMGLVSGLEHLALLIVLNAIFSTITALYYSRIRGKRMFRSVFPAALPGILAAVLVLVVQLLELVYGQPLINGLSAQPLNLPQSQIPALVEMTIALSAISGGAAVLWVRATQLGVFGPSAVACGAASISPNERQIPVVYGEASND